jgi:hypothetical protein
MKVHDPAAKGPSIVAVGAVVFTTFEPFHSCTERVSGPVGVSPVLDVTVAVMNARLPCTPIAGVASRVVVVVSFVTVIVIGASSGSY